ncbi:MAG TPA: glucan 1,4-alpha-glucosidase [Anaerolineaceae bacterium]
MTTPNPTFAPGWPGHTPRWTSSAKSGVGASLSLASHVWFTIGYGILDEVYFPRLDRACTRDLGLIVTDGRSYFSEEKRSAKHAISCPTPGVPAYHIESTEDSGRYQILKDILADPARDAVLTRVRFVPLTGQLEDYHLYVLLAPHINNMGYGNTSWVGDVKGVPMLFAERDDTGLALGSSAPWLKRSAGFVGVSDGWLDLQDHFAITWEYDRAENGNTALVGEIDLAECGGEFMLALAFGEHALEAGHHARASLLDGFDTAAAAYTSEWKDWQKALLGLDEPAHVFAQYRNSAAVLRIHEGKTFAGGIIASLSIPWGESKGDNDLGGYHLVWTRDLVESIGGLFAAGASSDAARVLRYLQVTQEADGHWPQNMWLDGTPYWQGVQIDEAAFPILLTSLAWQEGDLNPDLLDSFFPMVRQAASYILTHGPITDQDRWEEDAGFSAFTLAVEIAALLAAAEIADARGHGEPARYMRETADLWNSRLEDWIYVTGTDLARRVGVDGYYIRMAPPEAVMSGSPADGILEIKNRPPENSLWKACDIISPDALALVRFGLRSADDPRILNTVRVIDALLKVETPFGPAWHRYNEDGYGEHANGDPFDGTGIGRAWPLLTGERAHYELAAGRRDEAERLARTMAAFAGDGGMIPEQVWDSADLPGQMLFCGRPSGSAMPLVWAHAEYVKLRRSLREQRVYDMPPQTRQRYLVEKTGSPYDFWRFDHQITSLQAGKILRIELLQPALVHWSADGWQSTEDFQARDTGLGIFNTDLDTRALPAGTRVDFTFDWVSAGHWENRNYSVKITG